MTIDTPEFRRLELAYAKGFYAWEDCPCEATGKALGEARQSLIAHIDAQLARQRQGQAVHFVKSAIHPKGWHECDAADLEGHARAGFATRTLYTAAPVQGEPVAWMVGRELFLSHDAIPARLLAPMGNPEPLYLGPAPQADEVRDAARYRWLRHMVWDSTCFHNEGRMKIGAELDAAVDAAMRTTAADNQKG